MLNNIYQDFKNYLVNTFPDIKIDEYRGEFNDKAPSGWNPSFPCCLIKLNEYAPVIRSASNQIITHKAEFTLYIAEKNSLGFEMIQRIIDNLSGTDLSSYTVEGLLVLNSSGYNVEIDSVKFLTAINSVRVHTLQVTLI